MILFHSILTILISLATLSAPAVDESTDLATIIVQIDNVKTVEGRVLLGLYFPEDDFPHYPKGEYVFEKQTGNTFTYRLENIQPGRYAVSIMDDTNDNDEMDYNFVGLPKEGYGFSNNARPRGFKPPTFEDCAFDVATGETFIQLKMKYWTF